LSIATTFAGEGAKKRELMCNYYFIDKDFLPLLQIKLKEGRNISDSLSTDKTAAFLVNEAFVEKMGWTSALGQSMEGFGHKGKIVGVVRNFYYRSLHNVVEPLIMVYNTNPVLSVIIKIQPKDLPMITTTWKAHFPAFPFDHSFLDETYKEQYDKDRLTMKLFSYFTGLAILISCLGLFGLVSLMAVQRTREIGIRKVLGASVQQLITLLTRDLVKLIIIASLIALPLAGIAMGQWLTGYAYHISLAWWMFLLPVVLILLIALAVIGQQVIRAALANPVTALRTE
jgi:putative ABC transport system permease protein